MPTYRLWSDSNQASLTADLRARNIPFTEKGWTVTTENPVPLDIGVYGATLDDDSTMLSAHQDLEAGGKRSHAPEQSVQQDIGQITTTIYRGQSRTPRRATRSQPL